MIENNFDISVRHIAYQSRWFLNASRYALLNNPNNTEVFGTHRRSAMELIEDTLNQQLPTVRDQHGLSVFDDWAATFGETVTCLELAPEGQRYRVKTRFARFSNIPEMMSLTTTFADIKTHEALNLYRPAIHGGKPEIVIIPPTEALKTFIDQLGQRAEAVRSGSVDPHTDNMLAITTDGRKAALDMRLIHPNMVPSHTTKARVDIDPCRDPNPSGQ